MFSCKKEVNIKKEQQTRDGSCCLLERGISRYLAIEIKVMRKRVENSIKKLRKCANY